jgi:DUF971 family protein
MALTATEIILHKKSRTLEVTFSNGERFILPFQYLRVFSPSAEVRGHGGMPPKCLVGKENIDIIAMEPVGNYGIKPVFDDGHNTGIFSWSVLYTLGVKQVANWADYLERKKML